MKHMTNPHTHSAHHLQRTAQLGLLALLCLSAPGCEDVQGVKVYLSPANHGGSNIGCAGFDAETAGRGRVLAIAHAACITHQCWEVEPTCLSERERCGENSDCEFLRECRDRLFCVPLGQSDCDATYPAGVDDANALFACEFTGP